MWICTVRGIYALLIHIKRPGSVELSCNLITFTIYTFAIGIFMLFLLFCNYRFGLRYFETSFCSTRVQHSSPRHQHHIIHVRPRNLNILTKLVCRLWVCDFNFSNLLLMKMFATRIRSSMQVVLL